MRFLETQDSMISHYPIMFYLFSAICFASSVQTELLSVPGCPMKCGNITIPFPFGMSSECSFDHSFHIICDSSFEPPKPFLRLLNAEVVSISLDGKVELLNSSFSLVGLEEGGEEILRMVVDWAAGDEACHTAQRYGSRYACQSQHSQCMDSSTGQGHVCRCFPGYQGNPYLAHGCQDIDECAVSNPCEGVCENLPGSFKCHCVKGLVGDAGKDGKGCRHPQDQINWSGLVFLPIGIFVIAPFLVMAISIGPKDPKTKSKEVEIDFFEGNGGPLLKRKLKKKNPELHKLKEKIEKLEKLIEKNEELEKNLEKLNEKNQELKKLKEKNPEPEIYSAGTMASMSTFFPEINMISGCNSRVKFYSGTSTTNDVEQPGTSRGTSQNTKVEVVVQKIEGAVLTDKLEDFMDELIFLSEPRANLVRVLGCCLEQRELMIIYERRGNENTTLSDCTSSTNFTCKKRIEAAEGVARGLEHFEKFKFNPTFVRGDISSANIMIDTTSYEPKIFYVAGSNLIAPASAPAANDLKEKNDVFSFGKILVELLTGGRAVVLGTSLSSNSIGMTQAIRMAQSNILLDFLVHGMEYNGTEVYNVAMVAEKCLNAEPEERPTMKEVLDELLGRSKEQPRGFLRRFRF